MIMLSDQASHQLSVAPGVGDHVIIALAVNGDSLNTWVLPALAAIPVELGVRFEVHREDQATSTRLLRAGSVVAAITSEAEPVQGCNARRLGRMRYRPMCSPEFRERWFVEGPSVTALERAPMIVFDRDDQLQDRYLRKKTRRRLDPPRHYIPVSAEFAAAVGLGLGWGMLPAQQSAELERSGRLVELDPGRHVDVILYWQQWKLRTAPLDAVATAIVAAAKGALD